MQSPQELMAALQAAFAQDHDINLHEYPIQIRCDGALRLEGQVENIIVKRKARRIAQALSGTIAVEDHLQLDRGEYATGPSLQDAAADAMATEPAFREIRVYVAGANATGPGPWIRVSSNNAAVLRIEGEVGSLSHRRLAEVIAWWVPGCRDVHNQLRVHPAEQDGDDEFTDVIRMVLEKDPLLHAENIAVATTNRRVTLHGTIHDPEQRHMAVYDCWYVPGVHDVHDQLRMLA